MTRLAYFAPHAPNSIHDLSKNEFRERTMEKFNSITHFVTSERLDVFQKRMSVIGIADPSFWTRFGVHYGLFVRGHSPRR